MERLEFGHVSMSLFQPFRDTYKTSARRKEDTGDASQEKATGRQGQS